MHISFRNRLPRRPLILLAMALSLPVAADGWTGTLRLTASHQPLETVADSSYGWQQTPVAGVLPSGAACVAWIDIRQGGVLMAARVAASGEVLDPMGVPIAWGRNHEPLEILSSPGGCIVVYREAQDNSWGEIVGVELSWSEAISVPEERFRIPGTNDEAFLARNGDLLLFSRPDYWETTQVRRVGPDGLIESSPVISVALGVIEVTHVGSKTFVLAADPSGKPSMWRLRDDLSLVRIETTIPESSVLNLFPDGSDGLLLTSTRGTVLEVLRYGLDGTVREWKDGIIPSSAAVAGVVEEGDNQFVLFSNYRSQSSTPGTLVANLSEGLDVVPLVQPVLWSVTERGDRRLFLYRGSSHATADFWFELGTALPTGTMTSFTATPEPEVISDVAREGESLAILWTEIGTYENSLQLGLATVHQPEQFVPIDVGIVDSHRAASVAISGDTVMVLWVQDGKLWYRRAALDGAWIDGTPVPLGSGRLVTEPYKDAFGIGHGSLMPTPDGFATVWGEQESGELRLTTISHAGEMSERALPWPEETPGFRIEPADVVVIPWEGNYLVAFRDALIATCELTCPAPTYPVTAILFDSSWTGAETLIPNGNDWLPWTGYSLDLVAGHDEALLVTDGMYTMITRGAQGELEWARVTLQLDHAGATWMNGRFILAGQQWRSAYTTLVSLDPETRADAFHPLVTDLTENWWLPYQPRIITVGDTLLLFGSEVSPEASEGSVRRLRIHEIEPGPAPERRRSVRR